MNDIPPVDLNPGAKLKEITVIMTDNVQYIVSSLDLEHITFLTPKYLFGSRGRSEQSDLRPHRPGDPDKS